VKDNGGHTIRIWVHVEGYNTPTIDSQGFVSGTDSKHTLIAEMKRYVQTAQEMDILVVFVLWNGAYFTNQNAIKMMQNESQYHSYI